ncbi:MAG: hypothetical protein U1C97_03040 [Candidatus Gracilibacteria bacterium]|nr:hypothetical protein [Candidatus Gracilibacteria bacterium]
MTVSIVFCEYYFFQAVFFNPEIEMKQEGLFFWLRLVGGFSLYLLMMSYLTILFAAFVYCIIHLGKRLLFHEMRDKVISISILRILFWTITLVGFLLAVSAAGFLMWSLVYHNFHQEYYTYQEGFRWAYIFVLFISLASFFSIVFTVIGALVSAVTKCFLVLFQKFRSA